MPQGDAFGGYEFLLIASGAWGLVNCFFGYRIFKVLLALMGFVAGGVAGYALLGAGSRGDPGQGIVGAIVFGLVGAVLAYVLYFVAIFVLGALLGAALLAALARQADPAALAVAGLVGGVLSVVLQKFFIVLATALSGAWQAVFATAVMAGYWPSPWSARWYHELSEQRPRSFRDLRGWWTATDLAEGIPQDRVAVLLGVTLVLAVLGFLWQYRRPLAPLPAGAMA